MNEKIKNYLGITAVVVSLVLSYAVLSYVNSYSKSIEPSTFRSFSASGEGKITAIPDVARFNYRVITEGGKDIAKLQEENTKKNNKIIDFIKSQDIEKEDIKTEAYNLEPRYQYYSCPVPMLSGKEPRPCPPPEIVGYTITQSVSVKIRNFEKIGDILGGTVSNGANEVSQLSFVIDDMEAVKNKAREEAIEKAKEKAKSIAKAGGFRLGKLLAIEEGGISPMPRVYALGAKTMETDEAVSPTIEPGSQEIIVNVTLKYEIK